MTTKIQGPHKSRAPPASRAPGGAPQAGKHFQVGKDYAHAAHRREDGEAQLKARIGGTIYYRRGD